MARWSSKQLEQLGTKKKKKRSSKSKVPQTDNNYHKLIKLVEEKDKDGCFVEHYINPDFKDIIDKY